MMIMPSNNKSGVVHYFAGRYPGKIGLLISPPKQGWKKGKPPFYMPYALDNGCFIEWNPDGFFLMLNQAKLIHPPLWVCVPDVVADKENTIRRWHKYKDKVKSYGFKLAFVAQDGMTPKDIPSDEAFCCFVGGSTEFKMNEGHKFKGVCEWLHIGRVNMPERIEWAERIGADSVDGTGFFRGRDRKYQFFIECFEGKKQMELF